MHCALFGNIAAVAVFVGKGGGLYAMKKIHIGMVGTGWAGTMHAKSYNRIYGVDFELRTVCSLDPDLPQFAERYHFNNISGSIDEMLGDPLIDIVDIITPPDTHTALIKKALAAGKHVICEKPVTGYFGKPEDVETVGNVSKEKMLSCVIDELDELQEVINQSDRKFFYAENWIYSPSVLRASELVTAKKMKLFQIDGVTGHKGSHAYHAAYWKYNGGGALIRQGTHPVAAALWMKRCEAAARGETYGIYSVQCDASTITQKMSTEEKGYLHTKPCDVDDWAHVIITFTDGTKANITAGDIYLGSIVNILSLYGNQGVLHCNMTPNNLLNVYFSDEKGIEQEHIMEKNDHNMGYQDALVSEEVIRGYNGELQDFLECLAFDKEPLSGFAIARETLTVIYAAYLSAERGAVVIMAPWFNKER